MVPCGAVWCRVESTGSDSAGGWRASNSRTALSVVHCQMQGACRIAAYYAWRAAMGSHDDSGSALIPSKKGNAAQMRHLCRRTKRQALAQLAASEGMSQCGWMGARRSGRWWGNYMYDVWTYNTHPIRIIKIVTWREISHCPVYAPWFSPRWRQATFGFNYPSPATAGLVHVKTGIWSRSPSVLPYCTLY